MQSLCQHLQDGHRLSGSFFLKRGHPTRGNAKVLFVTLAYQLALHHPELNGPIFRSAERDQSVVGRGIYLYKGQGSREDIYWPIRLSVDVWACLDKQCILSPSVAFRAAARFVYPLSALYLPSAMTNLDHCDDLSTSSGHP
ncbi:hypothetical protein FB451DRAFT_1306275 [Mycena latifolia]|nr:hypothetical protein FB451DRAFT_1306275 [Mycena latifolia]